MNKPSTTMSETDNLNVLNEFKFNLDNPPDIEESGFIIVQSFLSHIKSGEIPNLEKYLKQLDAKDWSYLLAYNPRPEFIEFLFNKKLVSYYKKHEFIPRIDWKYILICALVREKELLSKIEKLTNEND